MTDVTFTRPSPTPTRAQRGALAVLPGFNVRVKDDEYKARVADIAASIEVNGFYEHKPFAVVMIEGDDTIYIYDGEHRLDAVDMAALNGVEFPEGLPVAFAAPTTTMKDLTLSLVHSNTGEPLSPVELASVVGRLEEMGMDKKDIAVEIGRTSRHVDNLLVLDRAPEAVKEAVASGQIAAAEATNIVRKEGKKAAAAVKKVVAEAKAKGKAKATPKTMKPVGPKTKTIVEDFDYAAGDKAGDFLRLLAGKFREHVVIGTGDKIQTGGKITLRMVVVDTEAEAARVQREADRQAALDKKTAEAADKAAKKKAADDLKKQAIKDAAKATAKKAAPAKAPAKKPTQAELAAAATKLADKTAKKPAAKPAAKKAAAKSEDVNQGL